MTRLPDELPFDVWMRHVFAHPADTPGQEWYWAHDAPWYDARANPQRVIAYLTRVFTDGADLLAPYTDAQVNQGLWYLVSNACSDYGLALSNPALPERLAAFEAMHTLFTRVFEPRCAAELVHRMGPDDYPSNPLNMVSYMWWDLLPDLRGADSVILGVMARTLTSEHIALHENALHGLGHWAADHPERVRAIIDAFLQRGGLHPHIVTYAQAARSGCVL